LKVALNNKHRIPLPANADPALSRGAQGNMTEFRGRIRSMTIGKYTFEDPEVSFGDETTSRVHPDKLGMIGLPLFMKFRIVFDYFNNRLYIEPNENHGMPFE
jgi:hypothetical protein